MNASRPDLQFIALRRQGATAILTIDNPPVNALHPDVAHEIALVADEIERDFSVRSLILTGTGNCFVAGGDIKYFLELDRSKAADMALRVQRMQRQLFDLRVPVVAALNGHALGGGCELMLACDIALAEEQATIGLTEVTLGVIPGAGGTQMLMANLPPGTAKRLLFTGERIPAADAQRYGLVDSVCSPGESLEAALRITDRINAAAPLAVEAAKRSANFGLRRSLDEGHIREASIFSALFESSDQREGISAFLAGRTPAFERR